MNLSQYWSINAWRIPSRSTLLPKHSLRRWSLVAHSSPTQCCLLRHGDHQGGIVRHVEPSDLLAVREECAQTSQKFGFLFGVNPTKWYCSSRATPKLGGADGPNLRPASQIWSLGKVSCQCFIFLN